MHARSSLTRPRLTALVLVAWMLPACRPEPAPAQAPVMRPGAPSLRAAADSRAFAWDRVLLVSGPSLGGPGTEGVAQVGRRVSVRGGDGKTWGATIEHVSDEGCDDGAEDGCRYVELAYDEPDVFPARVPWDHVDIPGKESVPEDIALLDVHLAIEEGIELPQLVPHTMQVRYANALCEEGSDEEYSLVAAHTSAGPDPIEGARALEGKMQFPRRVVTLHTLGRTLHFVTIAEVDPPASGRMFDIATQRQTSFFVLEGDGPGARVLHHESHRGARSMNVDTSCQLPVRYATPWTVVAVGGSVYVLTQASMTRFERWSLQPGGIAREGGFTAHVLVYG